MVDFVLNCVMVLAAIALWAMVNKLEDDPSLEERERRLGGDGQLELFNEALRTREVPSAADRDAWIRELRGKNVRPP